MDVALAYRRHYPAINWLVSYSLYFENVADWWARIDPDYRRTRSLFMYILQREAELEELVRLVGADALPAEDRLILEVARMIREDFLRQDALSLEDAHSSPLKTARMAKVIAKFYEKAKQALESGVPIEKIREARVRGEIAKMKLLPYYTPLEEMEKFFADLFKRVEEEFDKMIEEVKTYA